MEWIFSFFTEFFANAFGFVGRFVRVQLRFFFTMVGGGWGVIHDALFPSSWRPTLRIEFWHWLGQIIGGGVTSVVVVAVLSGFGIVAQAVFWLGFAGMAEDTGKILSSVLVREIAPVLVGIILLGRSGMLMLAELGSMTLQRQMRVLDGMGIDPFLVFVVPRTMAMTVSGFTLGMLFSLISLVMGYFVCWLKGIVTQSVWSFLFQVVNSVHVMNYAGIPLKFLLSGFVVGLSCCLSGLDVTTEDDLGSLLPRGFSRGILSIMIINVVIDVVLS